MGAHTPHGKAKETANETVWYTWDAPWVVPCDVLRVMSYGMRCIPCGDRGARLRVAFRPMGRSMGDISWDICKPMHSP